MSANLTEPGRPRRMPAAVMTATILLGFFGGLASLALLGVGLLGLGDLPLAPAYLMIGAGVGLAVLMAVLGMARGNRGAQIVAVVIGAIAVVSSVSGLSQGNSSSLLGLVIGAAIALLVIAPVSSRDWFSR